MQLPQFVNESSLLQNAERSVVGNAQQIHDAQGFILSQRGVGRLANAKFPGAAVALETVQQQASLAGVHPFQGLLDAALRDRGEQPRLKPRILHPVALVSQIQG